MTTNYWQRIRVARSRGLRMLIIPLATVLLMGGCDSMDELLNVDAPSRIPAENLEDPGDADLLVQSAIGDFECAFGAYVVLGGLLTDELADATQTADRWVYDRRDVQSSDRRYATYGCASLGVYTPLSTARWSAENALTKLEAWTDAEVDGRQALIATAAAYSGYSHLLLGEGFSSGVLLNDELEAGGEVQRQALYDRAVERFTQAIDAAGAAGEDEILYMALVGRARTQLNLGNTDQALADARRVVDEAGTEFARVATASDAASRRYNRVFVQNDQESVAVAPEFWNLSYGGMDDPRVEMVYTGEEATDGTPMVLQTKYTSRSAPLPIATGDEAQLIIAEVEAASGSVTNAVDAINVLHQRAGLPDFNSSDRQAVQDHVVQERSRELFLEGHRINDVRRLDLTLSPAPGEPFDNGGTYGDTRSFPLPDVERLNNPNIGG